ncbi:MAG TPA: acyl-CoA synthetase [Phycicoccus sp.]|nr:acyl-CoA synthetase [Phycicoccus sp.]
MEFPAMLPARFNMARYCLAPAAHRDPAKVALTVIHDPQQPLQGAARWTFEALDAAVRSCAQALREHGFAPGARIALRLGNRPECPIVWFAAMAAGLVGIPLSSQLTPDEVAFVLTDAEVAALVTAQDDQAPAGCRRFDLTDVRTWLTVPASPADQAYADTAADDPAYLIYTSGTSGQPKGVLHAHRCAWGRRPMYAGWYGLTATDTMLHAGALNWTYTLGVGLTDPWALGAGAVVYDGPRDPGVWGRIIAATGATLFAAVPGIYRQWLRAGIDPADLTTLRHGLTAGEALAPGLYAAWRDATGRDLYEALGMSEISTFISSAPSVPVRPGSPGKVQEGRRVAILPEAQEGDDAAAAGGASADTTPLPLGEIGVLAVHRSDPGLMLGYWNRPHDHPWRGDWFVTADAAHLDVDGYVHHHGRVDDILGAGGYRVSPLEVEHVLATHPAVADVAVTEVEVREGVRIIAAYAVPADPDAPGGLDAGAVLRYAGEHLAAYKCPKELLWIDALPRTANGKIRRAALAGRHP